VPRRAAPPLRALRAGVLAVLLGVLTAAITGAGPAGASDDWQGPPELRARVDAALARLPLSARVILGSARLTFGCHPGAGRCAWGTYDAVGLGGRGPFTVWLSPAAFSSEARLRYVLYHELAHHLVDGLLPSGVRPLVVGPYGDAERHADCVAAAYGGTGEGRRTPYWPSGCPRELVEQASAELAAVGLMSSSPVPFTPPTVPPPPPTVPVVSDTPSTTVTVAPPRAVPAPLRSEQGDRERADGGVPRPTAQPIAATTSGMAEAIPIVPTLGVGAVALFALAVAAIRTPARRR
jgi:hypothetical protein